MSFGGFSAVRQTYLSQFLFLNLGILDRNSALQLQKKILINEWSFLSENSLIKAWST
jgi:hypothetical protein